MSHLIKWDHSRTWDTPEPGSFLSRDYSQVCEYQVDLNLAEGGKDAWLHGHKIMGRSMLPVAKYLWMAWQTLAKYHRVLPEQMAVVLESVKISKVPPLPESGKSGTNMFVGYLKLLYTIHYEHD